MIDAVIMQQPGVSTGSAQLPAPDWSRHSSPPHHRHWLNINWSDHHHDEAVVISWPILDTGQPCRAINTFLCCFFIMSRFWTEALWWIEGPLKPGPSAAHTPTKPPCCVAGPCHVSRVKSRVTSTRQQLRLQHKMFASSSPKYLSLHLGPIESVRDGA